MKRKTIYETIKENLTVDGFLPKDFSFRYQETPPNELRLMPGAKDSIGMIRTALLSPVVRERHCAARALAEWSNALNKPLIDIAPDLYSVVVDIAPAEVNHEIKERIEKLLNESRQWESERQLTKKNCLY